MPLPPARVTPLPPPRATVRVQAVAQVMASYTEQSGLRIGVDELLWALRSAAGVRLAGAAAALGKGEDAPDLLVAVTIEVLIPAEAVERCQAQSGRPAGFG